MNILTDECSDEDSNEWLAPEESVDDEAEIIIDMGCLKKLKGLQMKNMKREHGGTKQFTIFLSESHDGPWDSVLTDELSEQVTDGCGLMQTFNLKYDYIFMYDLYNPFSTNRVEGRFLKFQVNSFYGKQGGLQYIGLTDTSTPVTGFTRI